MLALKITALGGWVQQISKTWARHLLGTLASLGGEHASAEANEVTSIRSFRT